MILEENNNQNNKKKKPVAWMVFFILAALAVVLWVVYPLIFDKELSLEERNKQYYAQLSDSAKKQLEEKRRQDSILAHKDSLLGLPKGFSAAAMDEGDTSVHVIQVSTPDAVNLESGVDQEAGKPIKRVYSGRRINIAVIGVDSRLGAGCKHADANQIISILIDKGEIEITSIPRDTPADAGMSDSSNQNKLTIVYSNRGKEAYFKEVARIAGLDKIHYYVELSFSQAIGLIEMFGFKDAHSTLQVLRSRTALGGNDYQRSYNQGQFIRQMMLKHFEKLKGVLGEVLLRGGLALVNTNLTYDKANEIINQLKNQGFPRSSDVIRNRVRPPIRIDYKIYDFNNQQVVDGLKKKIEHFNVGYLESDSSDTTQKHFKFSSTYVSKKLWNALNTAAKDTAKRPGATIQKLKTLYDQRAWLQVTNQTDRGKIRDQFELLLIVAYKKTKKQAEADHVWQTIEAEKKMFASPK